MSEESKYVEQKVFADKKAPVVDEYLDNCATLSATAAARGFAIVPGDVEETRLLLERGAKAKLTEANAATVGDERELIFKDLDFFTKLALKYSTLELEYYRESLLTALEWEDAQVEDLRKRNAAEIKRLRADTEAMNIEMIRMAADLEVLLGELKLRQIEAERSTLTKQLELINAQIETATERLRIIDATRALIDAEGLVLVAEEERAVALEERLAVEKVTAEMEEALIPLYLDEADARKAYADAVMDSIQWEKALAELGFRRIELDAERQSAEIAGMNADTLVETARTRYVQADGATQLARQQAALAIQEQRIAVNGEILALKETMGRSRIDLDAETRWGRALAELGRRISAQELAMHLGDNKHVATMTNSEVMTLSQREVVLSRAVQTIFDNSYRFMEQYVQAE